jgi:hypothetical protein
VRMTVFNGRIIYRAGTPEGPGGIA